MCRGLLKVIEKSPEISLLIENGKKKVGSLMNDEGWRKLNNMFEDYAIKLSCR